MTQRPTRSLDEAIEAVEHARACIMQNRGRARELAREGYERVVDDELVPAMLTALEDAVADLDTRTVVRLARHIAKVIKGE